MSDAPRHVLTILAVDDLPAARRFYAEAFGWPLRVDVPVYAEFALPDGRGVGLYQRAAFLGNLDAPGAGEVEVTGAELYFLVESLPEASAKLAAAGARLLSAPARRTWGDEVAYYADPLGNVLAVARSGEER
ncbi:MAG: VOC family protein [Planctomycetota bacterium]